MVISALLGTSSSHHSNTDASKYDNDSSHVAVHRLRGNWHVEKTSLESLTFCCCLQGSSGADRSAWSSGKECAAPVHVQRYAQTYNRKKLIT